MEENSLSNIDGIHPAGESLFALKFISGRAGKRSIRAECSKNAVDHGRAVTGDTQANASVTLDPLERRISRIDPNGG